MEEMHRSADQFPSVLDPTLPRGWPISVVKNIYTDIQQVTYDDPECQLEESVEHMSEVATSLRHAAFSCKLQEQSEEFL